MLDFQAPLVHLRRLERVLRLEIIGRGETDAAQGRLDLRKRKALVERILESLEGRRGCRLGRARRARQTDIAEGYRRGELIRRITEDVGDRTCGRQVGEQSEPGAHYRLFLSEGRKDEADSRLIDHRLILTVGFAQPLDNRLVVRNISACLIIRAQEVAAESRETLINA